jgi:hypothetical protein
MKKHQTEHYRMADKTPSPDSTLKLSRSVNKDSIKNLSRASLESAELEQSKSNNIHSRVLRKSQQGDFNAYQLQSATAISRKQNTTKWESDNELENEIIYR